MAKSKRFNIGLDVDGVLAGFAPAARKVCQQLFNGRPDDSLLQTTWEFDSLGITPKEMQLLYAKIDATPNWWMNLPVLPDTDLLPQLCEKHRVVFITNRKDATVGYSIEDQTKIWLKRSFGIVYTNVVISNDKGPVAKGLKLDYFLDDRPRNVLAAIEESIHTTSILLTTPYNRDVFVPLRAESFNGFVKHIDKEAQ